MTVLRDQVFTQIPDHRIRIYAVWQPILGGDSADALPNSVALLAQDSRVRQYWDPGAEIGRRYSRALELPMKTPAWDVYLLFGPAAKWEADPPLPNFWMHQLGFPFWSEAAKRFGDKRLDGAKFREEVEKILRTLHSQTRPREIPAGWGSTSALLLPATRSCWCDRGRCASLRGISAQSG